MALYLSNLIALDFPGIGLPAVVASGMVLANTLVPIDKHKQMRQKSGVLAS